MNNSVEDPDQPMDFEAPMNPPVDAGERSFVVQVLEAFQGRIGPPHFRFWYQTSLLFVAAMMVVLPLLYLALIAALVWAVWWWAHVGSWLFHFRGGGVHLMIFRLVAYFGPLLAGVIAVAFMFKPLFSRRPAPVQALAVNPGAEPVFYAYLSRICDLIRARAPAAIELSGTVNASAGLRRGVFSRELTLTIGLPLAAGLTMQELAGILAHEFGHFTQGFGMRLSYVIGGINRWFARVVYERDRWDLWLDEMEAGSDSFGSVVVVALARMAVGLSRAALRALMLLGHLISASALRQMEYGADEFGAKVAGSRAYEATLLRIQTLALAEQAVRKQLPVQWSKTGRLPDDLPALVHKADAALPAVTRDQIQTRAGLEPTGWLDTHPSLADRLRRVRQLDAPGVFSLEWPASALFQDFNVVARQVTLVHYRDEIGLPMTEEDLVPVHAPAAAAAETATPETTSEVPAERPKIRLRVIPKPVEGPPPGESSSAAS